MRKWLPCAAPLSFISFSSCLIRWWLLGAVPWPEPQALLVLPPGQWTGADLLLLK